MADFVLLNDKIDLAANTETLQAFAGEISVEVGELTDLELASSIITTIDGLDDDSWDAMTMALKEWSNTINEKKIAIAEEEKKAEIAAKAQKTKKANAAAGGAPTTPAAIKKAINDCKNKADIAAAVGDIARALGMEAPPKITKGWTVQKQKEAAIAGLKKPTAKKTPKTPAPEKTVKRTTAATPAQVKAQKEVARTTAQTKKAGSGSGGKVDGEPFRRNTSAWMVWDVFNKSKAKGGVAMDTVTDKFDAAMEAAGKTSTNPKGRVAKVTRHMIAEGICEKLETGNVKLVRPE
jgi:hypothetical protein